MAQPNYVLQHDERYRVLWQAYVKLVRQQLLEDSVWRWRHRLWSEHCGLALLGALGGLATASPAARSDFLLHVEQDAGRFVDGRTRVGSWRPAGRPGHRVDWLSGTHLGEHPLVPPELRHSCPDQRAGLAAARLGSRADRRGVRAVRLRPDRRGPRPTRPVCRRRCPRPAGRHLPCSPATARRRWRVGNVGDTPRPVRSDDAVSIGQVAAPRAGRPHGVDGDDPMGTGTDLGTAVSRVADDVLDDAGDGVTFGVQLDPSTRSSVALPSAPPTRFG